MQPGPLTPGRAGNALFESDTITIPHFEPTIVIRTMKYLRASTLALAIAAASTAAMAQASGGGDTPKQHCDSGYVTGVGGAARSFGEYLALPDRDRYRYLADHAIQCKISDEGRAFDCTGVTNLKHEQLSVYDDSGGATITVTARVELDQGTYPAIIVVQRKDVQCGQ